MPATVRHATTSDASALAVMDGDIDSNPWSEKQYLIACTTGQGNEQVLVVGEKQRLSGCLVYSQVVDEVSILKLMVVPEVQGQGLGTALMQTALACARDAGASRCMLEVRASNEPALGLYRRLGFREDGRRHDYYPTTSGREDAVLMTLKLPGENWRGKS